ncbi:MAG: type II toxin-antitoxin system Phd/YefM family antitoxin [Vulcanimicrobiaceae bacterium]
MRQAKAQFSALVHDASNGREWVISERGVPVARLVAIERDALAVEERLRRMEVAGDLDPLRRDALPLPPPLPLEDGLAQRLLQRDRDGR